MQIRYEHLNWGWKEHIPYLRKLASEPRVRRVCEIGGGANPSLSIDFVREHGLDYTVLDISQEELDKAPAQYNKVCADITSETLNLPGGYDLVFSKMLAEHVKDGRQFHRNIHRLLNPEGQAFHFFPTLSILPFVINRLLPERVTEPLLVSIQDRRERSGKHAKFPAYYDWCQGPINSQIRRYQSVGFDVEEFIGFFGHNYYKKIPLLHKMQDRFARTLIKHPIPWLTSHAYVVLHKRA
jgi:hypothetical protein